MVRASQVEGFVEIVRQGSVARAADVLSITQPALTARIQGLEAELGSQLFDRSHRALELSSAGRAFLPYAERALDALTAGRTVVGGIARGTTGHLSIGAGPTIGTYVLPRLLAWYVERWPDVRLTVRTGQSEDVAQLVLRREIDIGLIRQIQRRGLDVRDLYDDELLLVVEPSHDLAREALVPVERLSDVRLVLFDRRSSYYDLTSALLRAAGIAPRSVLELDSLDAAKQMVRSGLGVALLPAVAVAAELAAGTLRRVQLAGVAPMRRRLVAVCRTGQPPTPALTGFLETLGRIGEIMPMSGMILPRL